MMKACMAVFLLLGLLNNVVAQQRWNFRSKNYVGLLEGEEGSAFQLQTVNGFQYNKWFTGVGTGLDYYMHRTVPLFIAVTRDFAGANKTFFLSVDGGLNFAWVKETQRNVRNDFISQKYSPSLYWSAGLGYKIGLRNKKDGILFNIGYAYKHVQEKKEQPGMCINPPCQVIAEQYDYRLRRLSMKVGLLF